MEPTEWMIWWNGFKWGAGSLLAVETAVFVLLAIWVNQSNRKGDGS